MVHYGMEMCKWRMNFNNSKLAHWYGISSHYKN